MGGPDHEALKAGFTGIERVVADPLRFKLRLGIGEDAYASLRLKKRLRSLWDIGGVAAAGATVASSSAVATKFFAPAGFFALLGFGTAVTPIGWVLAAAVGSAGTYYGVTRLYGRYAGSRVETIPRFINTPIDLLGAALLDLMGALAVRLADIDGRIDPSEIEVIVSHFVEEWGFDPDYAGQALRVLIANAAETRIKDLAQQLAKFQISNPDCNADEMTRELMRFLREIAEADGLLDEREEHALDVIETEMRRETKRALGRAARKFAKATARNVSETIGRLRRASRPAPDA